MYCSKKSPNSDRVDGQNGALPGPAEGSIMVVVLILMDSFISNN